MSSKISQDKYSLVRMEKLKHFLETAQQNDKPRFYEIFVDNLKVVDKTADPALFDDYLVYMGDDTRLVKVVLYSASEISPRNDKFLYTVHDEATDQKQAALNGHEVENRISTAILQERSRIEREQLEKEVTQLKQQLGESEDYQQALEEQLEQITTEYTEYKKKKLDGPELNIGRVAGVAADYLLKNNNTLAQKYPLISALSGFFGEEEKDNSNTTEEQTGHALSSSYRKKETPVAVEATLSEQEQIFFLKDLPEAFTAEQFGQIQQILQSLMQMPDQVAVLHSLFFTDVSQQNNGQTPSPEQFPDDNPETIL